MVRYRSFDLWEAARFSESFAKSLVHLGLSWRALNVTCLSRDWLKGCNLDFSFRGFAMLTKFFVCFLSVSSDIHCLHLFSRYPMLFLAALVKHSFTADPLNGMLLADPSRIHWVDERKHSLLLDTLLSTFLMAVRFRRTVPIRMWCSLPQSAPRLFWTSNSDTLHLRLVAIWSSWFCVILFGVGTCGNSVPPIT